MTTREKIIVVAACIAVVGGGAIYLQPLLAPASRQTGPAVAEAENAFVEHARQQVESASLTDAERYVLDSAQSGWTGRPPSVRKAVPVASALPPPVIVYRYTGFVNMDAGYFAIINGREYRRGDVLQGGAGVVDRIEADHVVLLLENGSTREMVPFYKPAMKGEQK